MPNPHAIEVLLRHPGARQVILDTVRDLGPEPWEDLRVRLNELNAEKGPGHYDEEARQVCLVLDQWRLRPEEIAEEDDPVQQEIERIDYEYEQARRELETVCDEAEGLSHTVRAA